MSLADDRVPGGSVGKRVNLGGTSTSDGSDAGLIKGETVELGQIGGERNTDSPTNNYDVVHGEANYYVVDEADGTDIQISSGAPAFLEGVYVNEALAGATIILQDDATAIITLPAGLAAGTFIPFPSIRFNTDLTCNCEAGLTTGNITICWRGIE